MREITDFNLVLDGDFLKYGNGVPTSDVSTTEQVVRKLFTKLSSGEIRSQLEKEKTKDFENTFIYKEINRIWSEKNSGKTIKYAIVPGISTTGKYSVLDQHTSEEYVQSLKDNYDSYCEIIAQSVGSSCKTSA